MPSIVCVCVSVCFCVDDRKIFVNNFVITIYIIFYIYAFHHHLINSKNLVFFSFSFFLSTFSCVKLFVCKRVGNITYFR